jgi:DegT/DnrJ/EryC1/StrS aminotransferase family
VRRVDRAGEVDALEREISAILADRTGRECLVVPSGRVALYLALRCWLSPGDRILMSPVNDDVIFFVALAAGLRPVMAPLSTEDGNIVPEAVPEATWRSLSGVLTTNLYGLPDRVADLRARCDRLGIPLIEDAAHAIETEVGAQPIGTFGAATAFSLSKHVAARGGGVLVFADATRRPELERLRDELTIGRTRRRQLADIVEPPVRRLVRDLHLVRPARRARRLLGLDERERYRMPLHAPLLRDAIAAANGALSRNGTDGTGNELDRFDPWVRVDLAAYRTSLRPLHLRRIVTRLRMLASDRARRIEGVRRLRELDVVAPRVREGAARPLFRVPLLVEHRDAVRDELERRGIAIGYLYDPPLDDYAGPRFAEPSVSPDAARWWAKCVLPVDPLDAGRVLDALARVRPRPAPAMQPGR